MLNAHLNLDDAEEYMMDLAGVLFGIHRTLVNKGYDDSLEIIGRDIPLQIDEYPSGMEVFDWVIPNAWNVREAWVKDVQGNKVIDFAENNLHLAAYSKPFSGVVTREELFRHLETLETQPEAIPFKYLYYKNDWKFCLRHTDMMRLTDDTYEVFIDVEDKPGFLKTASCVIPGKSKKEIVFSTYLCHPALANDNLSGVITLAYLFKKILGENFNHTIRLLIVPETVGAIAWLAGNEDKLKNIIGGYVVYDCGDSADIQYKKSYFGDSVVDMAALHALKNTEKGSVHEWIPSGSDERQFNAPGIRLPFGAVLRSGAANYKEYHTSLDGLDMIDGVYLKNTVEYLLQTLYALDNALVFKNRYRGEPFISKHDIEYPDFLYDKGYMYSNPVKIFMSECDGKMSLLDIAEKWNLRMEDVYATALQFEKASLVERQKAQ